MAERDAYTRNEVLSMIMCDDDDNLMNTLNLAVMTNLGLIVMLKNTRFLKIHIH